MNKPLWLLATAALTACLVRHGRQLRQAEQRDHDEQELDAALADSFPASDPPSMTRRATISTATSASTRCSPSAWCV
ncbi:MAG: hypothetical protein M0Q42_07155 [Xanthomonadales bacterium]|nr:hypothetical protein [Xanthomonadales bacterium]